MFVMGISAVCLVNVIDCCSIIESPGNRLSYTSFLLDTNSFPLILNQWAEGSFTGSCCGCNLLCCWVQYLLALLFLFIDQP